MTVNKSTPPKSSPNSVVAFILAGGQSRRLFPFNKVLSDLTGVGRTLIQQAYDRCTKPNAGKTTGIVGKNDFFVLSDPSFVPTMQTQLRLPPTQFLSDPIRRGTWPAILWAMAHLRSRGPDTVMAVMTADHLIGELPRFRRAVEQAISTARSRQAFVTVGVSPTRRPEEWRGFGAIQSAKPKAGAQGQPIVRFEEKPSLERASEMIREGQWLWNAGMFFFRVSTAEKALARYQPEMADVYDRVCRAVARRDSTEAAREYEKFPMRIKHPSDATTTVDNTIDYAVITPLVSKPSEHLEAWSAATSLANWADVGEWTVLKKLVKPDRASNTVVGEVTCGRRVKKCILVADLGSTIDAEGIEGMVVAFSNGKALAIPVDDVPRLKEILDQQPNASIVAEGTSGLELSIRGRQFLIRPKTL